MPFKYNPFSDEMDYYADTLPTIKLTNLTDGYVPYHVSDAVGLANSVIYQVSSKIGIGCTPVANLEVEDGNTAASMLVKITQDDSSVYGLVIGNDTYSTTDLTGLRVWLGDAGTAFLYNYGAGDAYFAAVGTANTSDIWLIAEDNIYFGDHNGGAGTLARGWVNVSSALATSLYLGTDDTVRGLIALYGHAAGQAIGGKVLLYTSADYDASITAFILQSYEDDLRIGPDTDDDALKLTAEGDMYITSGSFVLPASEYVNFGGTQGTGGYGIFDSAGIMKVKDSGGTWREIKGIAVGGYYFNSTGVNPATELGYGTWTQVAQGQFLIGAT